MNNERKVLHPKPSALRPLANAFRRRYDRLTMRSLQLLCDPDQFEAKEEMYLAVRRKEGRVHELELIRELPRVSRDNPHYREWVVRARTLRRLVKHLRRRKSVGPILDLGCGNGWMSAALARSLGCEVVGVDLNRLELEQAVDAFGDVEDLRFVYADVFEPGLQEAHFGTVVLASSIQYFPDLSALVNRLRVLLRSEGEILIADSPMYGASERDAAQGRSQSYYESLGVPAMADWYHHHSLDDLCTLGARVVVPPDSGLARRWRKMMGIPTSPFPMISL